MSIFKRSSGDAQATSTAPPVVASSAAAGVVPPPAAPMYSTRQAEAGRVADTVGASVAENVRLAREAQLRARASVQSGVRGAVSRARIAPCPAPGAQVRTQPVVAIAASPKDRAPFDPACAQTALLNLAWSYQQAGAPIRAIHAYVELIRSFPGTDAADAAASDLVELSGKLAQEGQFHLALGIYQQLEQLL